MIERSIPREHENKLEKDFISSYLAGESVESLVMRFPYSEAHGYRLLDKWGVIKSAGRSQSPFGKAVYFLTKLVETKLPLEQLYYRHMPPSIKEAISRSTLHRIARHARQGLTRTKGTALIATLENDPTQILVGQDISIPNPRVGKFFGALSYPMTYSVAGEAPQTAITRVLQQEVLSSSVLNRSFNLGLVNFDVQPMMNIIIADVDVSVYHIAIPTKLVDSLASSKLAHLRFAPVTEVATLPAVDSKVRAGVREIALGYLDYLYQDQEYDSLICQLNTELALLGA